MLTPTAGTCVLLLPQTYLRHFHIQQITTKAHQRANSILRCFMSGNVTLIVRAFGVYVRPVLEYNSITWSPHRKQEIMMTEKVQRRFTKRIRGYENLTYTDHLTKLTLPTVELRRLHLDLIYCYKIVFGLIKSNFSDFLSFPHCPPCLQTLQIKK